MTAPAEPAWLPALFSMSPWSPAVTEALYSVFRRDFVDNPACYQNCEVWFFPERERGKELIFWHLVEREDPPRSGNRLPDFRRAERLPWARAMLDHIDDPAVLHWDYAEGDGDIHTYVWLQTLDYLIVMKKYRDGRRRLITAFWLEYENKRRKLAQKHAQRLL